MLKPDAVVVRRHDLDSAPAGVERVMLDRAKGSDVGSNAVGRGVWALIEQPARAGDIAARPREALDVAEETCCDEVAAFLMQLQAEGLPNVQASS